MVGLAKLCDTPEPGLPIRFVRPHRHRPSLAAALCIALGLVLLAGCELPSTEELGEDLEFATAALAVTQRQAPPEVEREPLAPLSDWTPAEPQGRPAAPTPSPTSAASPGPAVPSTDAPEVSSETPGTDAADGVAPQEAAVDDPWMPEAMRCSRRGRRRFCDGPRRIRRAVGQAAARAQRWNLEGRAGYDRLVGHGGPEELLAIVPEDEGPGLLWPVPQGFMGRRFGYVREGSLASRLHRGVDIPAEVGAEVRSTNAGLVVYADNSISGYGNLVVVLHKDDSRSLYAHLSRSEVAAGDFVERGQTIGAVGRTGLTRAPHLHFEWHRRALPRNPFRHFVERPTREEELRLQRAASRRRQAAEERLAEARARAERNRARRARRDAQREAE